MGGEAFELAFEHDFPHLYYRICRLQDAMTAYYLKQDVNVLVGAQFRAKDVPYIGEVAFPAKQGKKFCERMERYFRRVPRDNAELPRPMFVVEITVEYGEGDFERYRFDFRTYCEESVGTVLPSAARAAQLPQNCGAEFVSGFVIWTRNS